MLCATCKGIELRSIDRWDGKEKEIIQRYIHRAAEAQLKNAFYNPPVEITASGTLFYVHHLTLNALKDSAGPQNNDLMTKSNNNEGCDFCKIIFDVLKTGDVRDVPYNTGASLRDGDLKGLPEILLCLETRDLTNRDPGYCLKPDQAIDVRLGSSRLQVVALDLPGKFYLPSNFSQRLIMTSQNILLLLCKLAQNSRRTATQPVLKDIAGTWRQRSPSTGLNLVARAMKDAKN